MGCFSRHLGLLISNIAVTKRFLPFLLIWNGNSYDIYTYGINGGTVELNEYGLPIRTEYDIDYEEKVEYLVKPVPEEKIKEFLTDIISLIL